MDKYKVKINNKVYEVEIEKVDANYKGEKPVESSQPIQVKGDAKTFKSPIQGSVLSVLAKPNETVKTGDVLFIIEAMKLENEIVADQDGVVDEVLVSEGQVVDSNQVLMTYRG